MKRSLLIGLLLAVVLIVCGWLVYRDIFSNEELASKEEWSIVQSVEWQHRDKPGDKIEIVRMDEYSLVGIPVSDSRKEIWIMLNAKNPPYYKQLTAGNYKLSKQDFKTILASNIVSSTVANCLESHIEIP
jgi:transcription elongation factor